MRQLRPMRVIPDSNIYFSVEVPSRGEHHFRIPRPSVTARLLKPLLATGLWKLPKDQLQNIDQLSAELVEESVGAAIGTCWRHKEFELTTQRSHFERGPDGLLDYGAEVMSELYENGYSQHDAGLLISQVLTRMMVSLPSPPQEVGAKVDFTAAPKASQTSLTSISE